MGAVGSAATCKDLSCGPHAHCAMGNLGAQCVCNVGFQGNGFICRTPLHLTMYPLTQSRTGQVRSQIADLRVSTLEGNIVVTTYRDMSDGHRGYLMVGRAAPDGMQWHAPVLFSNQSQAF